jgi:hypothetical protein
MLAESRGAELRRQARAARLAAIATCCRSSAWARTARRTARSVARLRAALHRDRAAVACCAAA